jgi:type IV pilus assembly protein PilF
MSRSLRIVTTLSLIALVAACSSTPKSPETPTMPAQQPIPKAPEMSPADRAKIHTELAAGYYERGQMDVALEELDTSAKLDPNLARTYNVYGLVYTMVGEDAKAEQNFRRALQLAPQDSEIHQNWGWYLCSHGQPRESIPEFEQAIRNPLYKTPEIALVNAGNCSTGFGDTANAQVYFKRALAVTPGYSAAAYGLARIAYQNGQAAEARGWMKVVMQQTNPSAESLLLGTCIERKLGDRNAEMSYASQLRNRFPDSTATKTLATGGCE